MSLLVGVPSGAILEAVEVLCGIEVERCLECDSRFRVDSGDISYSDALDAFICDDCGETCDWCDSLVAADSLERMVHVEQGSYRVCEGCRDSFTECQRCCGFIDTSNDSYEYVEGDIWCLGCCERHLMWCEGCDCWVDPDQSCSTCSGCENCCERYGQCDSSGSIHDYSYKPAPVFHGGGSLYVGLELEVETGNARMDRGSIAGEVVGAFGGLVYCKSDSSLDHGFEIVTHPMSPDYFGGLDTLDRVLKSLQDNGCRSWQGHTCGLHVHMSRNAFVSPVHLFSFALFFYRNRDQVRALSGRRGSELERYASLTMHSGARGREDYEPRLMDKVRGVSHGMRNAAVNLQNRQTVEVRLFRGSLKVETVRGAVEFCLAVFEYCKRFTSRDLRDGRLSWVEFRNWVDPVQFSNLLDLCDRRGV